MVSGGRNIKSKLSPHLEPICLARVHLVKRRGVFYKLIGAERIHEYGFRDLETNALAWHLAESFIRLLPSETPEEQLFDIADSGFSYLATTGRTPGSTKHFLFHLSLKVLDALGYFPGPKNNASEHEHLRTFANMPLATALEQKITEHAPAYRIVTATMRELLGEENKSTAFVREAMQNTNF